MAKPTLEVADILRKHGEKFFVTQPISSEQKRVVHDLVACRTALKGGHVDRCNHCGFETFSFNSCRNRHCPRCQHTTRAHWLSDREADLLPVEYFHVVFSLPQEIAAIAHQNKRIVYHHLFRASWETLHQIAKDPRHLGAEIGGIAVLHTWGSNLHHHPHVHWVIPGGGLSLDGKRWVSCPSGFFLPVKALSRLFRGKFLHHLKQSFSIGELEFFGKSEQLNDADAFRRYLAPLYDKDWFVYAKPPFDGPRHVLRYLSRYTHRVAISNHRLVAMKEDRVSFRWKDYAHGGQYKILTLSAVEFIRRFLLHVLPRGFVRIRHFGFLGNRVRKDRIQICRELISQNDHLSDESQTQQQPDQREECPRCPRCGIGTMSLFSLYRPGEPIPPKFSDVPILDSS